MIMAAQPIKPRRSTRPERNMGLAQPALFDRTTGRPIFGCADPAVDVDDQVSEAYMALLRCAESFDPDRGVAFSTYTVKSMRRAARSLVMRQSEKHVGQMPRVPIGMADDQADRDTVSNDVEQGEQGDILARLMATLTNEQQSILHMRFLRRPPMTFAEIGAFMGGKSKETARTRVADALAQMRDAAEGMGFTELGIFGDQRRADIYRQTMEGTDG